MKAFEWLMTYGWIFIVVGLVSLVLLEAGSESHEKVMPSDFNYSESKQAVEDFYGVPCESTLNNSYTDQYQFECSQTQGNHTYTVDATVDYNESGPDEVHLYQ